MSTAGGVAVRVAGVASRAGGVRDGARGARSRSCLTSGDARRCGGRSRCPARWAASPSARRARAGWCGSGDEGDAEEDAEEEDTRNVGSVIENRSRSGSAPSGDRTSDDDDDAARAPAGEPAAQSWSALLEDRNRQPVIIGLGLCFLAAFSGSNTVIYFASSVLQEAGLTDPGLLTTAVGVPNLLGGVVALVATDAFGRRPLLLLSFGGMSLALAALSIASALTPGVATNLFARCRSGRPKSFRVCRRRVRRARRDLRRFAGARDVRRRCDTIVRAATHGSARRDSGVHASVFAGCRSGALAAVQRGVPDAHPRARDVSVHGDQLFVEHGGGRVVPAARLRHRTRRDVRFVRHFVFRRVSVRGPLRVRNQRLAVRGRRGGHGW